MQDKIDIVTSDAVPSNRVYLNGHGAILRNPRVNCKANEDESVSVSIKYDVDYDPIYMAVIQL